MRLRRCDVRVVPLGVWLVASCLPSSAASRTCVGKSIEPCFTHRGRLSSQNGIALTIWLIGTTRRVNVSFGNDQILPVLEKYLEMTSLDHSYIYGDFEI